MEERRCLETAQLAIVTICDNRPCTYTFNRKQPDSKLVGGWYELSHNICTALYSVVMLSETILNKYCVFNTGYTQKVGMHVSCFAT